MGRTGDQDPDGSGEVRGRRPFRPPALRPRQRRIRRRRTLRRRLHGGRHETEVPPRHPRDTPVPAGLEAGRGERSLEHRPLAHGDGESRVEEAAGHRAHKAHRRPGLPRAGDALALRFGMRRRHGDEPVDRRRAHERRLPPAGSGAGGPDGDRYGEVRRRRPGRGPHDAPPVPGRFRLRHRRDAAFLEGARLACWRRCPDCRRRTRGLLVVGDGPQEHDLRRRIAALGLDERVILAGRQADVLPYLHAADAFVLPSTANEGVPQAMLQAMACRLPVVACPVGGIVELLDGLSAVYPAEPGSPAALASDGRGHERRRGRAGQGRASDRWSGITPSTLCMRRHYVLLKRRDGEPVKRPVEFDTRRNFHENPREPYQCLRNGSRPPPTAA